MNVLLSIKPEYVNQIINKEKKYEFRKVIFKKANDIRKIFIYSSHPVKKIIGYFTIDSIIKDHPRQLWDKYQTDSGIDEISFFNYFGERSQGFAIKIKELFLYQNPIDPWKEIEDFTPPQSYCYFNQS